MTEIRWQDPPPPARRGARPVYVDIAAKLRTNPGRWALIFQSNRASASTTAWRMRNGLVEGFTGDFEFRVRFDGDDGDVYARFVGEPSPEVKR